MANLERKKFASMLRMLQTAFPRNWELHLHNLGVNASSNPTSDELDRVMERVYWMVPQVGIKTPAAWIKCDMDRAEAASAEVKPEAPVKVALPVAVPQKFVKRTQFNLGTDPAKTSGTSPPSSVIPSASVEPLRKDRIEHKPVRSGTDLAKIPAASPSASETLIKEPAARIPRDIAKVVAASASIEPEAEPKAALPVGVRQNKPVSLRKGPVKTTYELRVEAETAIVIDRLLSQAKQAIEAGRPREAAAAMYIAYEMYGARQQQIAAAVGKCQGWVCRMIRWRREGLKETPFGPDSRNARMARRIERLMPRKPPRGQVSLWIRTRLVPKDDAHATVSSGVLVIGRTQPEYPELPVADIKGSEIDASGRAVDNSK
jgi:hypothetical protein